MSWGNREFKYAILQYHPNLQVGELSDSMAIALVFFLAPSGSPARLWIDEERVAAIPELGCSDDQEWIRQFLADFERAMTACVLPEAVLLEVDKLLTEACEVLRFSDIKTIFGTSEEEVQERVCCTLRTKLSFLVTTPAGNA